MSELGIVVVAAPAAEDRWFASRLLDAAPARVRRNLEVVVGDEGAESNGDSSRRLIRQAVDRAKALVGETGWRRLTREAPAGASKLLRRARERRSVRLYASTRANAITALVETLAMPRKGDGEIGPPTATTEVVDQTDLAIALNDLEPALVLAPTAGVLGSWAPRHHESVALIAHAAWLPDYPGADGPAWALYHRDIDRVGASLHRVTVAEPEGFLIARATACLVPGEGPERCHARATILARDLLLQHALEPQAWEPDQPHHPEIEPDGARRPSLDALDGLVLASIRRDFEAGWLDSALDAQTRF